SAAASACCSNEATGSWPAPGNAAATDRLAAFVFRRMPDAAAPAVPVTADAVSDTLSPAEDTALDAPPAVEAAGSRAFANSQAVLPGISLRAVVAARDKRRAGLAVRMKSSRRSGSPWAAHTMF